jgi:putrescine aminotransferase
MKSSIHFIRNRSSHVDFRRNNGTTVAAATMQALQEENLVERCAEMGRYFMAGLRQLRDLFPDIIRDVRGRGLLLGVEIVDAQVGESLAQRMFDRNVLIAYTLNKPEVIRIEPPFVITTELMTRSAGSGFLEEEGE